MLPSNTTGQQQGEDLELISFLVFVPYSLFSLERLSIYWRPKPMKPLFVKKHSIKYF